MQVLLQVATLAGLLALFAAWGSWVWDSHRPITAPERLGEVVVHGVDAEAVNPTARALAVGVVGAIAEHYRTVDFVGRASGTADEFLISTVGTAPEPLLIPGAGDDDQRLDLTLEFAGAKIDSSGLGSFLRRQPSPRGSLSVAVSLAAGVRPGEWRAVASASFADDTRYGFRTEVSGSLDQVADMIGLRFVQAHYAIGDPFFAALTASDFRELWAVRRAAAELALRSVGSGPDAGESLRREAQQEYDKIEPMLSRYVGRRELQKLGAYLATLADNLDTARRHVRNAHESTPADDPDRSTLDSLLASLEVDISNRKRQAAGAVQVTATFAAASPGVFDDILQQVAEANENIAGSLGVSALREATQPRKPRIGLAIGRLPEVWDDRIRYVGATDINPDPGLSEHGAEVLSLISALAPDAEIVVSPIGSQADTAGIVRAIESLGKERLDVVYWPLSIRSPALGKASNEELWASSAAMLIDALGEFDGLAVLPAGNEARSLPEPAPARGTAFAAIGASLPDGTMKSYSNHGPGVAFLVPDDATVVVRTAIAEQAGTSYAGAVFAAGAALAAAAADKAPDGRILLAAIAETARRTSADGPLIPDFHAAARRLASPVGRDAPAPPPG